MLQLHWAFGFLVPALSDDAIFDINLSSLSHPPLWEPTLQEFFTERRGGAAEGLDIMSPVVLASPTQEEFFRHARRGYPILVADWGKGMQYAGWSGQDFATAFPFGYMKAEYIHNMKGFNVKAHDVKIMDDEYRFNIGNFRPDLQTMWYNYHRPVPKKYMNDPEKPVIGPYVWHVKDELPNDQKLQVQSKFEAPNFLQDNLNQRHMNNSFEIWLSPGDGSGAGAHNDGYCQSVVSLQLHGDKRWRKMLQPDMTVLDSFDEFDGGVYEAGHWKPDLKFVNHQEGAVVWPPGYLHETKTYQPTYGKCGASITFQFAFPQPVQYLRAFLPRLSLSSEVGHCLKREWSSYVTFGLPGIKPTPKEAGMKKQLASIFSVVDVDNDQRITVDEVQDFFNMPKSHLFGQHDPKLRDIALRFHAEDTVAYHDVDNDMEVSQQELWDSIVQWNVVRYRVKHSLRLVNRADRAGLEAFELSLNYMRRKAAIFPHKLRPELREIFSLPNGTQVFSSLRKIDSFSDQEFFSTVMARVKAIKRRKPEL